MAAVVRDTTAELDEQFKLLEFSYEEVLDATKHQDDKINRLLTTVAFLTAAALALAGLGTGGQPLTATFLVDGRYHLPLAIIGLAGFLAGVTISVIMLIASMTTPLVLPGRTNPVTPDVRYVSGPEVPQFYFNEISGTALPGWYRKWLHNSVELKRERNESLVRETHNLAVRTEYKYQRSNEAVAVLSFALLSFVLSTTLILVAAERQGVKSPLTLDVTVRVILAAIIFGYCLLQLLATRRDKPPTVLEMAYPTRHLGISVRIWSGLSVTVSSLVAPQLLLLPSEPAAIRAVAAIAIPVLAWLVLGLALPWYSKQAEQDQRVVALQILRDPKVSPHPENELPERTTPSKAKEHNARVRKSWLTVAVIAAGYAVLGVIAADSSAYRQVLGLAGAYASGLIITASAIWQLSRRAAVRAREFRQFVDRPAESSAV
ncbi:MAG TPA: hypothetical protein VJ851_17840 [Jatrophihabitans sp.]|nr:hypothetical protein [Jatrophihabitans sp.]